ncbi:MULTISPECIES: AraC family transcriptional regulator [unclassified Pseudomonas]|uniref:AraC family transcriptional regulator n=1 Tax=unclassified Pseudomonas TaxID=196821 RepID=UPI000BD97448|nr:MULTISPECIES: AraC family transcriptional regulator [unclassified Pseudomonas]PVZ19724.1 AraC-like DNA-binding protein [Pseudomonas sp. URIL14HWK12:I12]PVZ22691.1 AraC-like DNA-binding protein [Pseudomonas sp. URIL14HWK12:I10]PVZ37679.1 AraC-like DNA-binding protein [Pseudomonas sp. URIL14HWK12:I11]SNZ15498.1 AraC-type DNA-binding protein [Pseudomonas sp. URIL14HWK12:I9]
MPDNRAAVFEHRPADLEVILQGPDQSFRWYEHDYPYPLARWNHHPEYEIHLIRQGSGKLLAGDYIGPFTAGHVALIGPGLPHDWMGDLAPGERIAGRDVVLQFDGAALLRVQEILPELSALGSLFAQAQRGLEFIGATARQAALLLESIGQAQGLQRLIRFLELLSTLAQAPERDLRVLASPCYSPSLDARSSERINLALAYLIDELTSDLRLSVIAERVGMSEAGFSRFFKRTTGHGFIDLMRKLRIQRACRLLGQTRLSVTEICFQVGYENVSNFNRHFRHEMNQTPSDYRRTVAPTGLHRGEVHPGWLCSAGLSET